MVAVRSGALTIGEQAREIRMAAWALFVAGLDAGAGWRQLEAAALTVIVRASAVWFESWEEGAALEAIFGGMLNGGWWRVDA